MSLKRAESDLNRSERQSEMDGLSMVVQATSGNDHSVTMTQICAFMLRCSEFRSAGFQGLSTLEAQHSKLSVKCQKAEQVTATLIFDKNNLLLGILQ